MSTQTLDDTGGLPLRRANDYLADVKRTFEPEMLFDEFWREGELALMFGPSGSGKSILALQLADALARGTGFYGFRMPEWRRSVLYVDLRSTDAQFMKRCSVFAVGKFPGRAHKFPRGLFRDRPPAGLDLCQWLRAYVRQHAPQVVIIDDLTAVKNTHDGTLETLRTMRRLRELRDELGISILVLTGSNEPKGIVAETDLGRSQVLCTAADSVFALGRYYKTADDHYLIQTRAAGAVPFWTRQNAPTAKVIRTGSGLLEFEFDERFSPSMDPEMRLLICTVVHMQEQEQKTFREIAAELEISTGYACKLYHRWTPAMERGLDEYVNQWADEDAEFEYEHEQDEHKQEAAADARHFYAAEGMELSHNGPPYPVGSDGVMIVDKEAAAGAVAVAVAEEAGSPDSENSALRTAHSAFGRIPRSALFMASRRRRSVYDLERDINGFGREIWVESRWPTGQPVIWYEFDRKGNKIRRERDAIGITVQTLGPGPYL